ncbi:glycerol-3-phosphate cytidylyltransferase [Streptomyces puniciscabiei]|uniref:Glycerol-3-phosphate cytidylyltransferase n=1 Tax=Streptomyces puniciscabiei TaxID=164348 RepID=A0A542UIQ1_9ACTN|nr:adenylyltransferase/cytidyltransferase family protein [Streptomyces puniciscabiei]TQK98933.1 glycerol-3-phosphate cytidylyltransferase [Streptomyces puniciscabiei]
MEATRTGYASGVWDLFHIGHLTILGRARRHCDRLVAGVASDELTKRLKGRPPVIPLAERMEIVRSVRYVDDVVVETHVDKLQIWKQVGFDVVFKGDDWKGTPKWEILERRFAKVGVEVVYFPYTAHTSSTLLRRALELMQLAEPLHEEGHHEQDMSRCQHAVQGKEEVGTAQK